MLETMKTMAFEYIEVFYNRGRSHSTLGDLFPVQFLKNWIGPPQEVLQVA